MDTLQSMWSTWSCQSHIYQADHICDQLNEATSTFHAHGLPSDPDRSLLLLYWPGMKLPTDIRDITTTVTFKKHLKTLLFNVAYGPAFL